MILVWKAAEFGRLTRPKQEWLAVVDTKPSMLDAVRQLCAAFQSADIAQPSTMMMQSEADFERLAHTLAREVGTPDWVVNLGDLKGDTTGTIALHGILFLNPRIWAEGRKWAARA